MNCKEQTHWQAMIIDRLADELSEEDAVLLEQHLGDCESCMREAQVLTGVLREASGAAEWQPNPALEARLEAALHDLHAGAQSDAIPAVGADASPHPSPGATPDVLRNPVSHRGWLASLAGLGFRPVPTCAGAVLVLLAALTGFWTGRGQIGDAATSAQRIETHWSQAPNDTSRMSPQRPAGETSGADLLLPSPSFAAADPGTPLRSTGLQFVPVRSDAVDLPGLMVADSL